MGLGPGEDAAFIDGRNGVGINRGAAREEAQGRQRHVVRRRLVQSDAVLIAVLVLGCAHRLCPIRKGYVHKNPMEIHGKIATIIRPTISAKRYPQIGWIPSAGSTRPM